MRAHAVVLTVAVCAAAVLPTVAASAQQVTGQLGSPNATTTLKGNQLPAPAPKFGGVIKDDALVSKAWWPPRVSASRARWNGCCCSAGPRPRCDPSWAWG